MVVITPYPSLVGAGRCAMTVDIMVIDFVKKSYIDAASDSLIYITPRDKQKQYIFVYNANSYIVLNGK